MDTKFIIFSVIGGCIGLSLIFLLIFFEEHLPKSHEGNYGMFMMFWCLVFISLHVIFYYLVKASNWLQGRELKAKKLYISPTGDWWLGDGDNTFDEPVVITLPPDFNVDEFMCCAPPSAEIVRGMYKSEIFDSRLFDVLHTQQRQSSHPAASSSSSSAPRVLFIGPNGQFWCGDVDDDDAVVISVPGNFTITQFYSKDVFISMYKTKRLGTVYTTSLLLLIVDSFLILIYTTSIL